MEKSGIADSEILTKHVDNYRIGKRKESSSFENHKLNKKK